MSLPVRSHTARAESIRQLIKLLPDAKHIRASVKDEIRLCAEQSINMHLRLALCSADALAEIDAILERSER